MKRSLKPFCVLVTLFVAMETRIVFGDSLDERIRGDAQSLAAYQGLSPAGLQVISAAEKRFKELGRMPSYPEYLEILAGPGPNMSDLDRLNLFTVFGRIQRPRISPVDLSELVHAQRAALTSFRTHYRVDYLVKDRVPGDPPPKAPAWSDCLFAFDGIKVLFQREEFEAGTSREKVVEAYDGQVLRGNLERPGAIDFGTVQKLDQRRRLYARGNPLLWAKLLDFQSDLQSSDSTEDLSALAKQLFVYETPVDIEGVECVVVGNESVQLYCAPKYAYALVREHRGGLDIDSSTGRYTRTQTFYVLTNSDFTSVEKQGWLPKRSEFVWTRNNAVVEHSVTTVKSYEPNVALPDSSFTDVISKGAFISDAVQKVTYVTGKAKPLKLASSQVVSRNRMIWLVGTNILAVVIIGLVIVRLRRAKNRPVNAHIGK